MRLIEGERSSRCRRRRCLRGAPAANGLVRVLATAPASSYRRRSRAGASAVPECRGAPEDAAGGTTHAGGRKRTEKECAVRVGRDGGVATVYACLGCVLLMIVTGLAVQLGAAVLARQRAETAADLSALAGAAEVLQGPDIACAASVAVASANDAALTSCSVSGPDVLVQVSVQLRAGPLTGSAAGRARAGPAAPVTKTPEVEEPVGPG